MCLRAGPVYERVHFHPSGGFERRRFASVVFVSTVAALLVSRGEKALARRRYKAASSRVHLKVRSGGFAAHLLDRFAQHVRIIQGIASFLLWSLCISYDRLQRQQVQ